ncbi:hypothetical protein NVP1170O_096 [Vibrio phage 1.170.O._10N.261.52.C3]|nr:hypothetical protein NVP1170O_096 [Vibrio phage 1.170.O._10N.261.52.C3]
MEQIKVKMYKLVQVREGKCGTKSHYDPLFEPMTHKEALTMRSKLMYPSEWMLKEIKVLS